VHWHSNQSGLTQPSPFGWVESSLICVSLHFIGLISTQFFFGPGLAHSKKISSKIILKKSVISANLLQHFDQYRFVFLLCKYTNPVLKYPIFVNTLKNKNKNVLFSYIRSSLSKIKKIILYFHTTKKISKIYISMHFGFNN
jgi:hypothetical protein